jgi:hypothetical protein
MEFNKIVNIERLTREISFSSIKTALGSIASAGTSCSILFKAELSTEDRETLENIVANHLAIALEKPQEQSVTVSNIVTSSPFASKTVGSKKLFKRIHGVMTDCVVGVNEIIFNIPYNAVKITGIEMIGGSVGDRCSLIVLDTPTGAISTVPNYPLNQFGFDVCISQGAYSYQSEYDADLIKDMKLKVIYTSTVVAPIGLNFILNEVK